MKRFELGRTVMTRAVADVTADNEQFAKDVTAALDKYISCDWGTSGEEDWQFNNNAVESGEDRILAAYETCEGKIWIITECDRSYTTILFPSDY